MFEKHLLFVAVSPVCEARAVVRLRRSSPYWTNLELIATSTRSRRHLRSWLSDSLFELIPSSSQTPGASRSAVVEALDRFGIPRNGNGLRMTGHLPFGFDYLNHRLVKNYAERAGILMMRQCRAGGLSLREIGRQSQPEARPDQAEWRLAGQHDE